MGREPEHGGPFLEALFDAVELPTQRLPPDLGRRYGGEIGLDGPVVYANFVASLDGVVALGGGAPPSAISGGSPADRFVMGLLRACAGAVVVGAGTLRAEPEHRWTPAHISPAHAAAYRELRSARGLAQDPVLVVLSQRGQVDPTLPALRAGATIVTTATGAARVAGRAPSAVRVLTLGANAVDPGAVVGALRAEGHATILCEGGPTVFGQFVEAGTVDELFLTLAPRLAGRTPATERLSLVEGVAFGPDQLVSGTLRSARRSGSDVFLRYSVERA